MKHRDFALGFTFPELVIVVAIILLLGVSISVSYRKSQSRHELINSGEKIASALRQAQGLAQSGRVQNPVDVTDMRYGVAFVDERTYDIFLDRNYNGYYDVGEDIILSEVLPNGVSVANSALVQGVISVSFPPIQDIAGVRVFEKTQSKAGGDYTIDLFSQKTNGYVHVVISTGGVISVIN